MNKTIQMLLAQPYLRCYFPTENGTWVSYCVELDLSSMGYSVAEATVPWPNPRVLGKLVPCAAVLHRTRRVRPDGPTISLLDRGAQVPGRR